MSDELLREDPVSVRREKNLQAALLRTVVKSHPRSLTESQLVRKMSAISAADGQRADVRKALEKLVAVGLLSLRDRVFEPTPALLVLNELMLRL